jgi:hypothetical protein
MFSQGLLLQADTRRLCLTERDSLKSTGHLSLEGLDIMETHNTTATATHKTQNDSYSDTNQLLVRPCLFMDGVAPHTTFQQRTLFDPEGTQQYTGHHFVRRWLQMGEIHQLNGSIIPTSRGCKSVQKMKSGAKLK